MGRSVELATLADGPGAGRADPDGLWLEPEGCEVDAEALTGRTPAGGPVVEGSWPEPDVFEPDVFEPDVFEPEPFDPEELEPGDTDEPDGGFTPAHSCETVSPLADAAAKRSWKWL